MSGRTGHRGVLTMPLGLARNGVRPLAGMPETVARLARGAGSTVSRLARGAGISRRGVWSRPGRHHIEVRGVAQVGSERLIRRVESALAEVPGVSWAKVNAPTGRVVVAVGQPEPRLETLIATIAATERTDGRIDPDAPQPHPPEEGPRTGRALSALTADAFGLGLSTLTRILSYAPLPGEAAGLLGAVDLHPRLHALAGRGLRGDHRADSAFPLVEAVVQGLTGGWAGIVLDGAQRVLQWREARAELASWERVEPELAGTPDRAGAAPPEQDRPRPKPDGPVDRYTARALDVGALAGAAALPLLGRKRATALGLAALAKAPSAAREAYAAQLGRVLARRGAIVMDRQVLRELDRIDTLLLDERVLRTGRGVLTDLVRVPDAGTPTDEEEIPVRAFGLFDPDHPTAVVRRGRWLLGPLDQLPGRDRRGSIGQPGPAEQEGATLLGLVRGEVLVAVLRMEPEPVPGLELLPDAARRAGLRLVIASRDSDRYGYADQLVPGGTELVGSVRKLQTAGAMVMLVSADPRALGAADCGLGSWQPGEAPPAGAHLLTDSDLTLPALLAEAAGVARTLARQSTLLARAGSGLGAVAAFTGSRSRLPGRTLAAVNAAGSLALANGAWQAQRLSGQSLPVTVGNPTPWHLMPTETVLARLATGPAGLNAAAVRERTAARSERMDQNLTLLGALAEELNNPLTPVLAVGAGLSAATGSIVDAALVGGVVGLSALIGATHRVSTERSLADLLSQSALSARVRRDGSERIISAAELVPGDVVLLKAGDAVPADCRIIEATGLETDESSLTGESLPVAKSNRPVIAEAVGERRSMLYEGTTVAAGDAVAVVVATDAGTEVGRGMALARQGPPRSGVEARLTGLTRLAVPFAAGSAVAVAGAGLLRGVPLAGTAATAANLAVASVPEGLPFLAGAAQLAAARRLAEHGALVRNPRTIEALGRVDVLCFDKTGTLTEGRLRLAGVGDADRHTGTDELPDGLRPVLAAALRATPPADRPEECVQQTDRAVLLGGRSAQVTAEAGVDGWRPVATLPFESSRGYHATIGAGGENRSLLSIKGAPETVLPRCSRYTTRDGELPLDDGRRRMLHELLDRHAEAGQRVLAVAERRLPGTQPAGAAVGEGEVADLTFVGYLTLADGIRESAAPAVRHIREAGVHTIMITGDHPATAAAIASIISTDGADQRVVTGAEIDRLADEQIAERLAITDVVARCTPAHKVRIIQAMQADGRTVAMTGDGANDAPAIRLADVGIALGRRGTPAARAAADLVVTDDRLETIIATLVEGRAMWSSVRHALSILVGGNLGEIAFSVLSAAATGRSALNGRQLLLVNLLTDLVPAMSIAVRPPRPASTGALLSEGPDNSLGTTLTREIAVRATATTFGATTGWTLARFTGRRRRAGTVALASLVGAQLGQTLLEGGASTEVLVSTALSVGALATVIQTPGLSHFFGCTPLGPVGWSIATGSAVGATLTGAALDRLLRSTDQTLPADGNSDERSTDRTLPADGDDERAAE